MFRRLVFLGALMLIGLAGVLQAQQNKPDTTRNVLLGLDNLITTGNELYDFVIERGFVMNILKNDTAAPVDPARSGSLVLGAGFNFPFKNKFALLVQPGINWYKILFSQNSQKQFPTDSGNFFTYEKHRMVYLEAQLGFRYYVRQQKKNKVGAKLSFFLDVGIEGGLLTSSSSKYRYNDSLTGKTTSVLVRKIDGVVPYRFAGYVRLGSGNIAAMMMYRFSDLYDTRKTYTVPGGGGKTMPFPTMPPLELGISIVI